MAFAKARTALAQLEEKLRRNLGLAGEISATFQPTLTPVIIAGDLREAGNASNTGRSWMLALAPGGAGARFSIRFEADVLITGIYLQQHAGAANIAGVYLTTPGQAPAVAVAGVLSGTWVDRKVITGDQVPITPAAGWAALAGTDQSDQNRILQINGNPAITAAVVPTNIMLPAQSHLNFYGTAGSFSINLWGRIWP